MRERNFFLSVLVDLILLTFSLIIATKLRLTILPLDLSFRWLLFGVVMVVSLIMCCYLFGVYHRIWKFAGISDLLKFFGAVTTGSVIAWLIGFVIFEHFSWQILFLLWITILVSLGGLRFIQRIIWDYSGKKNIAKRSSKTLIIGAGEAGALIVRTLNSFKNRIGLEPVGFIDDDPLKKGYKLYGLPILGDRHSIKEITGKFKIESAIIAIPSVTVEEINTLAHVCSEAGLKVKVLPSVFDLVQGNALLSQVQELEMEDLLHRSEIKTDLEQVSGYLKHKTVLVTGAGGSIGSELSRQICSFKPKKLVLVGKGENSIYEIKSELAQNYPGIECIPVIADVRDKDTMFSVFTRFRPDAVFHAAAHKHVDLMEIHPEEAFRNNVFGTLNMARMADAFGSKVFVLISTDKAVNPICIMGVTKRLAEMIVSHFSEISRTKFAAVRFGNVLGSRGSVVNLFRKQISAGGPVTITDPNMRRYFMTIREAVLLVMQAGALAKGGEIFVLDMGEQVKIVDLASDMIRLCGLKPDKDIKIDYIGSRPGEKLSEELFGEGEKRVNTQHKKIFALETKRIDKVLMDLIIEVKGLPSSKQLDSIKNLAFSRFGLESKN